MRKGRPSLTARGVAATRGQLSRPRTPEGDADADERLSTELGGGRVRHGPLFHYLAARTRFFDDQILEALDKGLTQIVIVGAGYDGRALRFRKSGVRFFEIDHPNTQRDKRQRLERLDVGLDHLSFVPADFTQNEVGVALDVAGHDASHASLFVCEGVVVFLEEHVIDQLLCGLRHRATLDSILAIQLSLRPANRWHRAQLAVFNSILSLAGEKQHTLLLPEEALDLLRGTGWDPHGVIDPAELNIRARPGHALFVSASPSRS